MGKPLIVGGQLLRNRSFEDASLFPWNPIADSGADPLLRQTTGVPAPLHLDAALQVTRQGSAGIYIGAGQDLDELRWDGAALETDWVFQAYARIASGTADAIARIRWKDADGELVSVDNGAATALSTSAWTRVSVDATPPSGALKAEVQVLSDDATTFVVDLCSFGVLVDFEHPWVSYQDRPEAVRSLTWSEDGFPEVRVFNERTTLSIETNRESSDRRTELDGYFVTAGRGGLGDYFPDRDDVETFAYTRFLDVSAILNRKRYAGREKYSAPFSLIQVPTP